MDNKTRMNVIKLLLFSILVVFLLYAYIISQDGSYDTQAALTLIGNYTSLTYNVSAVAQSNPCIPILLPKPRPGPAYLIDGLSNKDYWYQLGLGYNWSGTSGFRLIYEIWTSNAVSVYPSTGIAGELNFSGPIHDGDTVLLNISFHQGNVLMSGYDWDTGSRANVSYSASNSTYFVGGPYANITQDHVSNNQGEGTGLMTEELGCLPNPTLEKPVTYTPYNMPNSLRSSIMFMHSFGTCRGACKTQIFFYNTTVYSNEEINYTTLCEDGWAEYSNSSAFVTGSSCP